MQEEEPDDVERELASRQRILVAAGLFIEDPEADEGLTFPVPDGVKVKELLTSYDTRRTTGRKVRCAACRTRTPHYRGFRVTLEDGGVSNIGIDCGEQVSAPGAWDALSAGLSRRQDAAYHSARVAPSVRQLDLVKELLPEWLGRINALGAFHCSLPHRLRRDLAGTARLGGMMQHDKTRKLSRTESRMRSGLRSEVYTKTYGVVPSPGFFGNRGWEGKALRSFRALTEVRDGIAFAQGLPKLVAAFARLRDFRKRLEEVHSEHEAALANIVPDWWEAACTWANTAHQPEGAYRIKGRTILHDDGFDEDERAWEIPTREEIGESMWPRIRALWPT